MSAAKTMLTAQEFDNYPFEEDKRYELDEGQLIEMTRPTYKHNRVLRKLIVEMDLYFRTNPIGEVLVSENLYALSPNTRRAPDVAVILGNRYEELKDVKEVWLIDPDVKEIEIWKGPSLPDPVLAGGDVLASTLLPGFALPLEELFA
jgi:Uma2 family endonuclease